MSTEAKTSKASREEVSKKRESKPPAIQHTLTSESALPTIDVQRAVVDPHTAHPLEILALQRNYGNEAVQRLLVSHNLRAKLTVGAANDSYEQEADRVAAQIMSIPAHNPDMQRLGEDDKEEEKIQAKPLADSITPLIQRQNIPEEDEEKPLQGKFRSERETFDPGTDFESRLAATRGSGKPLPKTARDFMEQRFGVDFSNVRLHTGSESAQLNREVSAQAFTRGQDIYLGEGKENMESSAGKQLLAHELTHVVQQTGEAGLRGKASIQRTVTIKDKLYNARNDKELDNEYPESISELEVSADELERKVYGALHGDVKSPDSKGTYPDDRAAVNAIRARLQAQAKAETEAFSAAESTPAEGRKIVAGTIIDANDKRQNTPISRVIGDRSDPVPEVVRAFIKKVEEKSKVLRPMNIRRGTPSASGGEPTSEEEQSLVHLANVVSSESVGKDDTYTLPDELATFLEGIFKTIELHGGVKLNAFDLFHGHMFSYAREGKIGIGIIFHAREMPEAVGASIPNTKEATKLIESISESCKAVRKRLEAAGASKEEVDAGLEESIRRERPKWDEDAYKQARNFIWTSGGNNVSLLNPQAEDAATKAQFAKILDLVHLGGKFGPKIATAAQELFGETLTTVNYFPGVTRAFFRGFQGT